MAVEIIKARKSDISSKKGKDVRQFKFSLDGQRYTIDLAENEWNAFLSGETNADGTVKVGVPTLLTFATPVGGVNVTDNDGQAVDGAAIREWAKANGYSVSDRGKLAQKVKDEYAKAHGLSTTPEDEDVPADA